MDDNTVRSPVDEIIFTRFPLFFIAKSSRSKQVKKLIKSDNDWRIYNHNIIVTSVLRQKINYNDKMKKTTYCKILLTT